ncbi:DUF4260 domain-containing protein [Devosia aurantiaca]|uniref:DUF4260 domain-containing protein n=1 Tax=Devosia aurantiaca TaxID=2714858 RepID=A0A6M1T086_9HYPH|nr:DUF4260 domain-containing protein [Devosia aurantiaca]NGP18301.1 DUF4260 domain-containing protein [Devosia aurantiaca]
MTLALPAAAATGSIRTLLRFEGLSLLAFAVAIYFIFGGNPWLFALSFFAPDLSFIAYRFGPRAGAIAYNAVHSYPLPLLLAGLGWLSGTPLLWQIALILAAHIGLDRSLGYGLKFAASFNQTHLGPVGKKA